MNSTGASYREERIALLGRIVRALEADERVVAAWLAGSVGRGNADEISDLDLWVVIEDGTVDGVIDSPATFALAIVPTIMEITAPQNAPVGGAYLLTWVAGDIGPQQVDWYWQPERLASRPPETILLFQRREVPLAEPLRPLPTVTLEQEIGLWVRETMLMAFIAGKHIGRGDQWVVSRHLVHVARCVGTVEWLIEHGRPPTHDDELELRLPATVPSSRKDQLTFVRGAVGRLTTRLIDTRPKVSIELAVAVDRLGRWLDWIGAEEAELD